MWEVIGETLPLALGVAISPIPIIATILMLLSPKARSTSCGFLAGWTGGIVVSVAIFTVLSTALGASDSGSPKVIAGIIKVVFGVLLLLLAVKQWRGRPRDAETVELPKWMSAIDTMTAGKSTLLAFALAAFNPKNLLLAASAGIVLGQAKSLSATVVGGLVFVVVATATVAGPVIAYLVASKKLLGTLDALRIWLVQNNATIMAVLLLVMGVSVVGKGLASF